MSHQGFERCSRGFTLLTESKALLSALTEIELQAMTVFGALNCRESMSDAAAP